MIEIIIDEEFQNLLPALDEKTYKRLEESIVEHGCRDALVTWKDILIDGYNRYSICTKHEIPFSTVTMEFQSREEVIIWIIENQVSRRNLTPIQLTHYRGTHYRMIRKIKGTYTRSNLQVNTGQNDQYQSWTENQLSKKYRVSPKTIRRDAKISETIDNIGEKSPEAKRKILSGEISINKRDLEQLSSKPKAELEILADEVEDGSYSKNKPANIHKKSNSVSINPETQPFEAAIVMITSSLFDELRKQSNKTDTVVFKTTLRSYIDKLENIYRQI